MANLTKELLRDLEGLLNQREIALRNDIRRESGMHDHYAEIASQAPDPGDASFADLSVDLGNAAVTRDLVELRAIESARLRIKHGTYGDCLECGYEIPYERLLAQPMAERCAPCQQAYEKTHIDLLRGGTM